MERFGNNGGQEMIEKLHKQEVDKLATGVDG